MFKTFATILILIMAISAGTFACATENVPNLSEEILDHKLEDRERDQQIGLKTPEQIRQIEVVNDFIDLSENEATTYTVKKNAGAHYLFGTYLLKTGDYKKAVTELSAARELDSNSIEIMHSLAQAYFYLHSHGKAEKLCREIINKEPDNYKAYFLLGQVYEEERKTHKAAEQYSKAIDVSPTHKKLYEYLAKFYMRMGRVPEQIAVCERLVQLDPNSLFGTMMLSFSYLELGRTELVRGNKLKTGEFFDKSASYFREIIRLRPKYVAAFIGLGELLEIRGDDEEALQTYKLGLLVNSSNKEIQKKIDKLLRKQGSLDNILAWYKSFAKEYPNSVDIQQLYARNLFEFQKYDDAITQYKYLARLTPDRVSPYRTLGTLYYLIKNQPDQAVKAYRKAIVVTPDDMSLYALLGECLVKIGKLDEALKTYDEALTIDERATEIHIAKADVFRNTNKRDKALYTIKNAIDIVGATPKLLDHLVQLYYDEDNYDGAIEELIAIRAKYSDSDSMLKLLAGVYIDKKDYKAALKIYSGLLEQTPRDSGIHISLSFLYEQNKEMEEAEKILEKGLAIFSDDDLLLLCAASFYLRTEEYKRSEELLQQLLNLYPLSYDGYVLLGSLKNELKDYDQAEYSFRKAIKLNPSGYDALNHLGYMFAELGKNLDEAEELIKEALKLKPGSGFIIDSYGWVLYQRGDYEGALPHLEKALQRLPDDPVVNDHVGDVYNKLGNTEGAEKHWQKSNEIKPKPEVKKKIKNLGRNR